MDILSDVLDAIALRATDTSTFKLDIEYKGRLDADEAVTYILLSGRCAITSQERILLLPGDAVLLLGGVEHTLHRPDSGLGERETVRLIRCVFKFERALPHPLPRCFPTLLNLKAHYLTDETELGRTAVLLDGELINGLPGINYVALRLAEIVFVELLRRCQLEGSPPPFLAALSDPIVCSALGAIHSEPAKAWKVEKLAKEVGLSRTVFSARFHRFVGEPPLRYLRMWRLLRARRGLERQAVPIREAARNAGYHSSSGFSRAFSRLFGYPPSRIPRPE